MAKRDSNKLRHLKKLLEENPDSIKNIKVDKLSEIRKDLNPYNTSIVEEPGFLAFSYLFPQNDYLIKFTTTSMIAYLNAAVDEWDVPQDIPPVSVYDYVKNPNIINEMTAGWQKTPDVLARIEKNNEKMQERIIVKKFLEHLFQYDPHEHVRSAYVPPDPEEDRKDLPTPAGILAITESLSKNRIKVLEDKRIQHLMNMAKSIKKKQTYTLQRFNFLTDKRIKEEQFVRFIGTSAADINVPEIVYNIIPPADIFQNFEKYRATNYEKLLSATNTLYAEINDFEFAVMPAFYSKNEKEVMNFVEKYKEELVLPINVGRTGKWNIVSSYKANRDVTDFISKDSILLRKMMEERAKDAELAKKMMHKRKDNVKKENTKQHGPVGKHMEIWKDYMKHQNTESNVDMQEFDTSLIEQEDLSDNEMEVPVMRIGKGGLTVEKNKFNIKSDIG